MIDENNGFSLCVFFILSIFPIEQEGIPQEFFSMDYEKQMYWGPWRPGIYCGMRTRSKQPVFFGVGWGEVAPRHSHKCEQTEDAYGWTENDGTHYGFKKSRGIKFFATFNCEKKKGFM